MKKIVFSLISFSIFNLISNISFAKIESKNLIYKDLNQEFEGFLANPSDLKTKKPGIILIHQWMGLTEYEKMRSEQLAKEGYIVLAADIYGKGVRASDANQAGKLATIYKTNRQLFRERIKLAYNELLKKKNVDPNKIIVMGYCFGGTGALEFARSGAKLVGTASFHGGLDSLHPEDAKNIKGSMIVFHGAIDPFVPAKDVEAFKKELDDSKIDYQFISYANAVHAFTQKGAGNDNSKGAAYNELADKRSWQSFLNFLKEVTK